MRSALGRDAFHAGILDAHLLLNKEDLLVEAGNPSRAGIGGIGLSARRGHGQSGQGYGWTAAEQTFWGQFLGSGRGRWGCWAMKVLSKNMKELSGPFRHNAMNGLDLADIGAY